MHFEQVMDNFLWNEIIKKFMWNGNCNLGILFIKSSKNYEHPLSEIY
jgi:hypothetical protein